MVYGMLNIICSIWYVVCSTWYMKRRMLQTMVSVSPLAVGLGPNIGSLCLCDLLGPYL